MKPIDLRLSPPPFSFLAGPGWRLCVGILLGCCALSLGCRTSNEDDTQSVEKAAVQKVDSKQDASAKQAAGTSQDAQSTDNAETSSEGKQPGPWRILFNGKDLEGWELTNFGGEREVTVSDGSLMLEMGYPMTGVTSTLEDLPTSEYEISLEAKRIDGIDFFCGLTFPVDGSHCSLIVGGWGGTLVGLSCIDGDDAAHNDTKSFMNFETDQWYTIRVKVLANRIQTTIDNKRIIDRDISGCELSVRNETLKSRPLGFCCFETDVAVRNFRIRKLDSETGKTSSPSQVSASETDPAPPRKSNDQ